MLKHNLNSLGSDKFERLCQGLLKEIIGNGVTTFGTGKDGAREATFKGKAPYPSQVEQWDGDWIFQVKFHDIQTLGGKKAREEVLSELKKELDKIVTTYKHSCNNYILITNVQLSGEYKKGNRDKIAREIVPKFLDHIKNIHVWDGNDVDDYLNKYEAIRNAFAEFLSPSDLVAAAINHLHSKNSIESESDFDFPNFIPGKPDDEILRDGAIRYITQQFNSNCTKQILAGMRLTGKTNILAQLARQYSDRTISYFITKSPATQELHVFLFSLCQQMKKLIGEQPITPQIPSESLKSLYLQLYETLRKQSKARKIDYYLVIDGLEWALEGKEGNRIIDFFPLNISPYGPYLLCTCCTDKVKNLPSYDEYKEIPLSWRFNDSEAKEYFGKLGLTDNQIKRVNIKYNGIPGYLSSVKRTKLADPEFDLDSAPEDIDSLINQQVESVFNLSSPMVREALEFLAVSPIPLLSGMLSALLDINANTLIGALKHTGLIVYDSQQTRLEYCNEIAKEIAKAKLGERRLEVTKQLLEYIKVNAQNEGMLIDLLIRELSDYAGVQERLMIPAVIDTINSTGTGISGIIKRYQMAFEMAQQYKDTDGLVKWTLGVNVAKSFVSHAINQDEINALISIGEFKEALQRVYPLEVTTRIRLLARTYISMRAQGEYVPEDAINSLKEMTKTLKIEELDKDIAQEIAIDLLPILKNEAYSLMERVIGKTEKQGIIETTIESVSANLQKQAEESLFSAIKDRVNVNQLNNVLVNWQAGKTFEELVKELQPVKEVKAKEYFIRQWCRHNPKNEKIGYAIYLWQETVLSDRKAISLRSLRQVSELIIHLPVAERKGLIDALKIPEFISIDSPKEEWVRVRLNLAEALYEIDPYGAIEEIEKTHSNILQTVIELDEKAFCLARLLVVVSRIIPQNKSWIDRLEREFQGTFDDLLKTSADHFELTKGVIQTLVERNPNEALIVAIDLNTQSRQAKAARLVLRVTLLKYGETDVSLVLKDALQFLEDFDERERDIALLNIVTEFRTKDCILDRRNLDTLYTFAQKINDFTIQSIVLGNLAVLYKKVSAEEAVKIGEHAIEAWQQESDLKARLSWGYKLVESLSEINLERAKALYEELKILHLQPTSALAVGNLGVTYREVLDLAIRAMNEKIFRDSEETIRKIEELIQKIPAKKIQVELYARLAASAYRSNCNDCAETLIRTKILPEIKSMPMSFDRELAVYFSFPIIFEYDQTEAKELIESFSSVMKVLTWHSTVLWSLCRSYLGDHDHIEVNNLRVTCNSPRFQKVISVVSEITNDALLYESIVAIANSIRASFHEDVIDWGKALDLLRKLDDVVSKNPPDWRKKNLHHEGYLILAQAVIHGVRSDIFQTYRKHKGKSTRELSKPQIGREWRQIISKAQNLSNIADRVFVLASMTKYYRYFFDQDISRVMEILETAEKEVQNIPTLLDRVDRFCTIGESYENLGKSTQAQYILEKNFESVKLLKGLSADQQLRTLVQTANKIDSKLAEQFVSKLDRNRYPNELDNPANITFQIQQLVENPSELHLQGAKHIREDILEHSSQKLIGNLVSAMDNPRDVHTLEKWLSEAIQYHPRVIFNVTHWVLENLHRKQSRSISQINLDVFLETAELIYQLAQRISPSAREGLPTSVGESFPILNQKLMSFQAGDVEYVQKWLRTWLNENVAEYLKICDPYFGKEELDYLKNIPDDSRIKVLISTTDKNLDMSQGKNYLQQELQAYWKSITCRTFPNVFFCIVPHEFEDKFNDRAIISSHAGLNLGQSLNGLGKSRGNITMLTEEETKELEMNYIQNMLNPVNWFMQYEITATTFSLRD